MKTTPCPCCGGQRGPGKYLCFYCWWQLSRATRYALLKRDDRARDRLQELYDAITRQVPLPDIRISV